ncbi:OsmC family protein [Populibacterium corticicola]|uniref:OsmC family protein n=1 Tax=Populibacterium corticicola TaxID=1812826 RepID=A0ABW5XHV2_9MICO
MSNEFLTPKTVTTDQLWVERVGAREYVGNNDRGATVRFAGAGVPDSFTPGEILKLAAAACTALVTDRAIARRVGDDYRGQVHVSSVKNEEENRYESIEEKLVVDLSGLDAEARERLVGLIERTVESQCTVGRTIEAGARVTLIADGE